MTSTLKLIIVSQDKEIFNGEVDHVNVTGEQGDLGIFPRHAPLLGRLKPGIVSFNQNGEPNTIYISGGFVEVQPQVVSILADVAIHGSDLNRERILKAKQKVEDALANNKGNFDELSAKLKREIAKLKAYELMNISNLKKK